MSDKPKNATEQQVEKQMEKASIDLATAIAAFKLIAAKLAKAISGSDRNGV